MKLLQNIGRGVRQHRRDLLVLLALFIGGATVAMVYHSTWGAKAQFWQETSFTPGIMWLAGEGWRNPMVEDVPGLEAFLYGEVDTFDVRTVPDGVRFLPDDLSAMSYEEINAYHPEPDFPGFIAWQRYHSYLVYAVTLCWLLFGVAWTSLAPLCGVLYGTSCAALYGIFRLGMGRFMSTLGALMILTSPMHLQMVPQIRDYAKAPFILLVIFILGWLIKEPRRRTHSLIATAALGAIIGIGAGFRMDLLMTLPAVVAVLFLFRAPSQELPRTARLRIVFFVRFGAWGTVLLLAFIVVLVITGFPILQAGMGESGHFAHVALLGFLEYCDGRLGVASDLYSMGGPYSDYYLTALVSAHMEQKTGVGFPVDQVWSQAYHDGTKDLLWDYVRTFPADILTRAYASVFRVVDELHMNPQHPYPPTIENASLLRFFDFHSGLQNAMPGGGRYYVLLVFLILPWKNFRMALGAFILFLFFCGYPGVQFNLRHYFFLEFVSLWATCFLIFWSAATAKSYLTERQIWQAKTLGMVVPRLKRCVLFVMLAAILIVLPWWLLMGYQANQVDRRLEKMLGVPWWNSLHYESEQVEAQVEMMEENGFVFLYNAVGEDGHIVPAKTLWVSDNPSTQQRSRFVILGFEGLMEDTPLTVNYSATDRPEHFDFSHTVTVPACPDEETRSLVALPLFQSDKTRFQDFSLPEEQVHAYKWMLMATEANTMPRWLWWTIGPEGNQTHRHQHFTR